MVIEVGGEIPPSKFTSGKIPPVKFMVEKFHHLGRPTQKCVSGTWLKEMCPCASALTESQTVIFKLMNINGNEDCYMQKLVSILHLINYSDSGLRNPCPPPAVE